MCSTPTNTPEKEKENANEYPQEKTSGFETVPGTLLSQQTQPAETGDPSSESQREEIEGTSEANPTES